MFAPAAHVQTLYVRLVSALLSAVAYVGAATTRLIKRPVGTFAVVPELNDVVSVAESVPVGYEPVSALTASATFTSEAASV